MSKPKVSIIIPAYNAAKTLAATVDSILAQTLRDFEILIIDDGSKDETGAIADAYVEKDSRVHLIHQENQGAFMARVNGINASNGRYLGFVDADDTISPDMYGRMVAFAEENGLDIVQSEYAPTARRIGPEIIAGRDEIIGKIVVPWLFKGEGPAFVWDKIYRRSCVSTAITPLRSSAFEDLILNLYFFLGVERYGYLHEYLYNYGQSATSTTRNFSKANVEGFKAAIAARADFAPRYGLSPEDPVFDEWILLNAGNLVRQAARSPGLSCMVSIGNVASVIGLEEVLSAMARSKSRGDGASHSIERVRRCPRLYVMKTRLADYLRRIASNVKCWALGYKR